jgi:uncharacterized protein involved in type VI secretion and phage assembly
MEATAPRVHVQYRETDLNFIQRLLEEEGIYYFFKHEEGKHTLVLADSARPTPRCPGYESILYLPKEHKHGRRGGTLLVAARGWRTLSWRLHRGTRLRLQQTPASAAPV